MERERSRIGVDFLPYVFLCRKLKERVERKERLTE